MRLGQHFTRVLVLTILLAPVPTTADTESFKEAYQAYQEARTARNWPVALRTSDTALQEGLKMFDKDGENVSNLRLNYARELMRSKQYQTAVDQLTLCLEAKSNNHGNQSTELIDPLLELGKSNAYLMPVEANKYFSRALDIARKDKKDALTAKIQWTAGMALFKVGESDLAEDYLEDSHRFYSRQVGLNDLRVGMAGLNLGRIQFEDRKNRKARKTLTQALEAFSSEDAISRQLNAATRKMLVIVLETLEKSDAATEHCLGFAMASSVNGNAVAERLFEGRQFNPPLLGVRNSDGVANDGVGGTAIVEFDVSETGFVINTRIKSSSSSAVESVAIKTAESLRYSPQLSKGAPVVASGLEFRFELPDNLRFGGD
ncbi:MAG: TonB family protein [bacterium]|nr:TonB family protein [Gammaproteobacteria bacterium]HIL95365.1 TonB family protein [Pseudomonadales bacterium]